MFKKFICILCFILLIVVSALGETTNKKIKIELNSNKSEYFCGEPILLKTIVTNLSDKNVIGDAKAYGFGGNFTMYISYDGIDFDDILWLTKIDPNLKSIATIPRQFEFYVDRYLLLNTLPSGKQAERLDMFIISKSGIYRLKSVLRKGNKEILYTSEPIKFSVITPTEKYDSLSDLRDPNLFVNLGSTIFYAHHLEGFYGGSPGKSLDKEEFEKIAPQIIEKYKDSAFREYVLYADIMGHERGDILSGSRLLPEKYKQSAMQFEKEYPDSWLLPDVYRRLFLTYVYEKNKEKAEQVRDKAIGKSPNSTVLRNMKQMDTNSIKPRK